MPNLELKDHPVVDLVNQRLKGVEDDATLVLAIEGGMFRGAHTGGMVAGMEELGISAGIFNKIIGTSAGFINASYYVAGNAREGVRIYPDHLHQRQFIKWSGLITGQAVINMPLLINGIMETEVPLDWDGVVEAQKLYSVVADPRVPGARVLGTPADKRELMGQMFATTQIPILAGRPGTYNGQVYYDGSLASPLPIAQAVELGATHILALSGRRLGTWRNRQALWERTLSNAYDKKYPGIAESIARGVTSAKEREADLIDRNANPIEAPFVLTIDVTNGIPPLENSIKKINAAIESGKTAIQEVFMLT